MTPREVPGGSFQSGREFMKVFGNFSLLAWRYLTEYDRTIRKDSVKIVHQPIRGRACCSRNDGNRCWNSLPGRGLPRSPTWLDRLARPNRPSGAIWNIGRDEAY